MDIIQFGKYKNKSFEEVYNLDSNYCNWICSINDNKNKNMINFKKYIKNKNNNNKTPHNFPDNYISLDVIRFGKYKNKSFEEVYNLDSKYCDWVLSTENNKNINMIRFKEFLLQKKINDNNNIE